MWRVWIVEVISERGQSTLRAFPDAGAYDAACEYAGMVRREATSRNKAVQVEIWEMTDSSGVPRGRIAWKPRRR